MKQRSELAEETDSLLRACWTLAEMLFSINPKNGSQTEPGRVAAHIWAGASELVTHTSPPDLV